MNREWAFRVACRIGRGKRKQPRRPRTMPTTTFRRFFDMLRLTVPLNFATNIVIVHCVLLILFPILPDPRAQVRQKKLRRPKCGRKKAQERQRCRIGVLQLKLQPRRRQAMMRRTRRCAIWSTRPTMSLHNRSGPGGRIGAGNFAPGALEMDPAAIGWATTSGATVATTNLGCRTCRGSMARIPASCVVRGLWPRLWRVSRGFRNRHPRQQLQNSIRHGQVSRTARVKASRHHRC